MNMNLRLRTCVKFWGLVSLWVLGLLHAKDHEVAERVRFCKEERLFSLPGKQWDPILKQQTHFVRHLDSAQVIGVAVFVGSLGSTPNPFQS
eukprot:6194116-Pleurochrysis_carterae.AAC.1